MQVYLDTEQLEKLAVDLKGLPKYVFKRTVKSTLSEMAYNLKKRGIQREAKAKFKHHRSKNMWQAMTRYEAAKSEGKLEDMYSWAGISTKSSSRLSKISPRFKEQEEGGLLNRTYVPLTNARTGGDIEKRVRREDAHGKVVLYKGGFDGDLTNLSPQKLMIGLWKANKRKHKHVRMGNKYGTSTIYKMQCKNPNPVRILPVQKRYRMRPIYIENKGRSERVSRRLFILQAAEKELSRQDKIIANKMRYEIERYMTQRAKEKAK